MRDTETWVPANRVEGCMLINIGDLVAQWSNDLFHSPLHRVRNTETTTRYSAPYFFNCDFDTKVECMRSLTPGQEAKYPPMTAGDYLMENLPVMGLGLNYQR